MAARAQGGRPKRSPERLAALLPVLGLLLCALLAIADPRPLTIARYTFFDQLQRWHPREAGPARVSVVDIDDASLARLGQWPWPRIHMAALVEALRGSGAHVIGFDMLFAEADRTSPAALSALWPLDALLSAALARLPDHDETFARAIGGGATALGYALDDQAATHTAPARHAVRLHGAAPDAALYQFPGRLASLPAFEAAAAGLGHVSVLQDIDGVVRKLPLVVLVDGQHLPALGLELLRLAEAGAFIDLLPAAGRPGLGAIGVGALRMPTTPQGESWLHYSRFEPRHYLPAWQLLDGTADAAAIRGRIVLVGSSAALLHDLRVTPLGDFVPGVEVHRQFIEQALSGRQLTRPDWILAAELLALLGGGALVIALARRQHPALAALALAALLLVALAAADALFAGPGVLLDPVAPAIAWTSAFALASLARVYLGERRQRWIREAFSRYVSPNLVRHLLRNPQELELGGHRQECSFVFTDLEGFTRLVERSEPREAVELINRYLDGMIAIVFRHEGTLMRIAGDALAVMFSAPVLQPDHARRALDCAFALDQFACAFAAGRKTAAGPFGRTRIGVHSGEVTVGNFGGAEMFDYRALGDAINVAARLESANKQIGTRLCVSAATLAGCPGQPARPVGRLLLRGKSSEIEVFEPVLAPDPAYSAAFAQLREGAATALAAFAGLAAERPQDTLVAFQWARLREGAGDDRVEAR